MPGFEGFKAKVDQGLLLNNRFTFQCGELRSAEHMCQSVSLPVISMQFFEWKQTGAGLKIPNNFTYEPLTATFIIDKNGQPYKEAFQWINSITTFTYQFNDMDSYEENITIKEYAPDDSQVGEWNYLQAYPFQISPREKTNAGADVDTFSVTFAYRQVTYK